MNLTAIILTHNEELMLPDCLKSVSWADEIIVIDKKSQDSTREIAEKFGAKVVTFEGEYFDEWRNVGITKASSPWIFYIDPDERVTPELKAEIEKALDQEEYKAFRMPRKNFWWGKEFKACGASPDYVTRLFKKNALKKWQGIIHESPLVEGETGTFDNPLLHYTHRDLMSGLRKSMSWTVMEAQLLFEADHPKISWWRLGKVSLEAFIRKYIKERGFTEGTEGFIESFVQAWNRFMVYEQLWEMQQKIPKKR
ncbi:MAG: glycosyltransferase family 2 protein [Patescibacteria group bacterium]|jgi:glycosyltransferase involved in cell wall biosynthesis